MSVLNVFLCVTVLLLMAGFFHNVRNPDTLVPYWYLNAHLLSLPLFMAYKQWKQYVVVPRRVGLYCFAAMHDVLLLGLFMLVCSSEYFFASFTMFYYALFFSIVIYKRWEQKRERVEYIVRTPLPRKTFVEMTNHIQCNINNNLF